MKLYSSNTNFKRFHFLKTVYIQFYLYEINHFSLFINLLSYHKKNLCDSPFIKNKTLMEVA
jgi:hypothetical protein